MPFILAKNGGGESHSPFGNHADSSIGIPKVNGIGIKRDGLEIGAAGGAGKQWIWNGGGGSPGR